MRNGEDWTEETERAAEEALGYTFENKALLRTAFTHPSYKNVRACEDNDRLEFLGDAVLQICVSERIFARHPAWSSGKMTEARKRCVSKEALTSAEQKAGLMQFLRYSGGRENLRGKTASNLFEAVTAAIFLDGGKVAAEKFIFAFVQPIVAQDHVTELQEYVQSKIKKAPVYAFETEKDGNFRCRVSALGKSAQGSGESKQIAKTQAAQALLQALKREDRI